MYDQKRHIITTFLLVKYLRFFSFVGSAARLILFLTSWYDEDRHEMLIRII